MAEVIYKRGKLVNVETLNKEDGSLIIGYDVDNEKAEMYVDIMGDKQIKRYKISNNDYNTVDQNYSPSSSNAQSGKAVSQAISEKPGQKTPEGGEIFNDYETNQARTQFSSVKGYNTLAGGRGYKIIKVIQVNPAVNGIMCKITLDEPTTGLKVDDIISARIGTAYTDFAKIISIDDNTIAIDKWPPEVETNNRLDEDGKPTSDDAVLWVGTFDAQKSENGQTLIGAFQSAEGKKTVAIHESAHAEGCETIANSMYSHAEGLKTIAGYAAHAEGENTKALGNRSHTEGEGSEAIGSWSHAGGYKTKASANGAYSEGILTIASGYAAHAEGAETVAKYAQSHASGLGTESDAENQMVVGRFNKLSNDSLFVVGNGTRNNSTREVTPSNALEVKMDGSAILQKQGDADNSVVIKSELNKVQAIATRAESIAKDSVGKKYGAKYI